VVPPSLPPARAEAVALAATAVATLEAEVLTQSPPLLAARYAATFAAAPCRAALPPPMARLCGLCSRALLLQARRKLDAHRSRRLLSSLRILPVARRV